ncbi:recombinase family protein [Sphingomonas sp. CFBP 13720]|uniref:recombinase family protein n=1 Tax=Sphingomonas sp. CFBP 13720 TaxID=2775302 RepID=UPI001780B3A1|nr:recombinase family protein [Sphingomonas sp. CFBP 13720]MBD8676854.1 recombinase family protein [Sphingomonas sp. CFBP 13720]
MSKSVRCAIYTRKSSEEGLEQSFNSLHAQREACEAYILSQKHEGWTLVPTAFDDGGFSGGSMDRPALKFLLAEVEQANIDIIVVYKVDRLTRSLADFAKMVDRFDARSVSFVSVTQAFNTTTSMGRLTLNVLLSFAQFEREVTGERIRDKIAASKAKGMWMGGMVPLGYDVVDRQLVINELEAEHVRTLFKLYAEHRAADLVVSLAKAQGIRGKHRGRVQSNSVITRGSLYRILANPVYAGEIGHKGKRYPGQHDAIIALPLFEAVQSILDGNRRKAHGTTSSRSHALGGRVCDPTGTLLTATHTRKGNSKYHYYANDALRLPAEQFETCVAGALAERLATPGSVAALLPDLGLLTGDVLERAADLGHRLGSASPRERGSVLASAIAKVVVRKDDCVVMLAHAAFGLEDIMHDVVVPVALARHKSKLQLVVPGAQPPTPDRSLIEMVAQARNWFQLLRSGEVTTLVEIADRYGLSDSYVRNVLPAAFIAPDIVTRIVEGRQPPSLTVRKLRDLLPLPTSWDKQRALLDV